MPRSARFACAHTPQLLARPETEDREIVLRVHDAFGTGEAPAETLRPDVIAMVAGDHIEALLPETACRPSPSTWDRVRGRVRSLSLSLPDPRGRGPGDPRGGRGRGFDLFYTQDARLDICLLRPAPLHDAGGRDPPRPLHVNVYLPRSDPPALLRVGRGARRDFRRPARAPLLMVSAAWSHFWGGPVASPDVESGPGDPGSAARGPWRELGGRPARSSTRPATWSYGLDHPARGRRRRARRRVLLPAPSWHHCNAVVEWPL